MNTPPLSLLYFFNQRFDFLAPFQFHIHLEGDDIKTRDFLKIDFLMVISIYPLNISNSLVLLEPELLFLGLFRVSPGGCC